MNGFPMVTGNRGTPPQGSRTEGTVGEGSNRTFSTLGYQGRSPAKFHPHLRTQKGDAGGKNLIFKIDRDTY